MQFTVGFRIDGKSGHLVVAGDDAPGRGDQGQNRHPHAFITYVVRKIVAATRAILR